ncbi:MAG TPA: 4'-phosphopantetheinyl transferase superfamily protein [Polyangia bacterium]|nr:4'-phosphopantetheinyl transferase superfamily protein [Polyangia bacterium]
MAFERRFLLDLPFGICVGVALPEDRAFELPEVLHPVEAAFARARPEARRAGWVGGRVALRAALAAVGVEAPEPMLSMPRGAPLLPPGAVGSVSHKRALAVALVAREADPRATVGIDVEDLRPLRTDIASRVLTPDELAVIPSSGLERDAAVLLRFSAKEAIYKALDPWVHRFVGFHEASVARAPDGALTGRFALAGGEGPFSLELHQAAVADEGEIILVAARVRAAEAAPHR